MRTPLNIDQAIEPLSKRETADARAAGLALFGHVESKRPVVLHLREGQPDTVNIPAPAVRLLQQALSQLGRGLAVTVMPVNADITTQRAAELLGISRPSLVKLLEDGELPHHKVGTHRRVALGDLIDYRQRVERAGRKVEEVMQFDAIDAAIRAFAAGEMVVVVDDDDRENEGDLIMAATKATPEQVAFMIRHTSGILCVPMLPDRARALQLDPMVATNNAPLRTAFTVSVDYADGLTTGISAGERANTVRALANGNVVAGDFVRPGHVFPLIAKAGGVLVRSGHTEATVDLARLAGLPPVGVIGELVNDDGSVKRLPQLLEFAKQFGLKIVSIADLIAYRRQRERLVERVSEFEVPTEIGMAKAIAYATPFDTVQHLALVFGDVSGKRAIPVRMHREELIGDVFGRRGANGTTVMSAALQSIKASGCGIVVYLREGAAGVQSPTLKEQASGAAPTGRERDRDKHWREVGVGAQILRDIGVSSITLLTTHQTGYVGLSGFGIEIAGAERIGHA
jgi:3,4-dihydroxy 2-butanone 4-phosphate synthase / GTP cyclohydrolase II